MTLESKTNENLEDPTYFEELKNVKASADSVKKENYELGSGMVTIEDIKMEALRRCVDARVKLDETDFKVITEPQAAELVRLFYAAATAIDMCRFFLPEARVPLGTSRINSVK